VNGAIPEIANIAPQEYFLYVVLVYEKVLGANIQKLFQFTTKYKLFPRTVMMLKNTKQHRPKFIPPHILL